MTKVPQLDPELHTMPCENPEFRCGHSMMAHYTFGMTCRECGCDKFKNAEVDRRIYGGEAGEKIV